MPELTPELAAKLAPYLGAYLVLSLLALGWVVTQLWRQHPLLLPNQVPALPLPAVDYLLLVCLLLMVVGGLGSLLLLALLPGACLLLWHLRTGSWATYLSRPPTLAWGGVLLLGLAIHLPLGLLAAAGQHLLQLAGFPPILQPAVELFLHTDSAPKLAGLFLYATVGAPLIEEFLFRGLLYPIAKAHLPRLPALLLTAALFAGIHQHAASFLPLFLLGGLLVLVFEHTRSLWPCVFLHALFNTISASFLLLVKFSS